MWTEILSTEGQKDSRQDTGNGMGGWGVFYMKMPD